MSRFALLGLMAATGCQLVFKSRAEMRHVGLSLFVFLGGCHLVFRLEDDTPIDGVTADTVTCEGAPQADPDNCGACGHSCHGGACMTGVCQPMMLTTSVELPHDIGLSATHVYWAAGNAVVRIPKVGGDPETVRSSVNPISDVVVDSQHFYYLEGDGLFRCELDGCAVPTLIVNNCSGGTGQLAISNDFIANSCDSAGQAFRTAKSGFAGETVANSMGEARGLAVENNDVYVADRLNNRIVHSSSGNIATPFFSGVDTSMVDALAIDATQVYWITDNKIGVGVRQTGSSKTIAPANAPTAIAVDDGIVFVTGGADAGYVQFCASTGCGQMPTVIATELDTPVSIAVDDQDIYVLTAPGGINRVLKLAR